MSHTRAEIDARSGPAEVAATALVGGIPLVVRPLRLLARLGWNRASVVVEDADAAERVKRVLGRYPVATSLAIDVVTAGRHGGGGQSRPDGDADGGAGVEAAGLALDGRAIYRPADLPGPAATVGQRVLPEPVLRVRSAADAAAAERALYVQIRKSVEGDGFFAHHFIRPLTRPLTRALLGTRISPNQVTAVALLCALAAAFLAAAGGGPRTALAGLLYWIGNALDCVDGDLARLRVEGSKLGEWLDSMTDEISTFTVLAGLGVGLWRDGSGAEWLWIGVGGSAIGALTVARLYVDLHRMGLPIDSAQFPWFFARPGGSPTAAPGKRTIVSRLLHSLGFLIRRDANVTGMTLLLLLGWRELATVLAAAGATAGAIVTVTHYLVLAMRPARTPR